MCGPEENCVLKGHTLRAIQVTAKNGGSGVVDFTIEERGYYLATLRVQEMRGGPDGN
jgi:hypothetical protein